MLPLIVLIGLVNCGGEDAPGPGISDAPRFPTDQGTVTDVTDRRLVLDEKRSYPISSQLESFKTHTGHEITAVLNWKNKYVHIGVERGSVVWIAGIGITIPGDPRTVIYSGIFKGTDKDQLIFKDGTVLKAAPDMKAPELGKRVVATIDADRHRVIELT